MPAISDPHLMLQVTNSFVSPQPSAPLRFLSDLAPQAITLHLQKQLPTLTGWDSARRRQEAAAHL